MIKRLTTRAAFPMVALGLLLSCSPEEEQITPTTGFNADATSAATTGAVHSGVKIKRGHYMVVAAGNSLPSDIQEQLRSMKGNVTSVMDQVGIVAVTSSDPDFAAKAGKIKGVGSVIPDLEIQWRDLSQVRAIPFSEANTYNVNPPSSADSDPYFWMQWGHTAIQAPAAWNEGAYGVGVRVAVLDGGFDFGHRDLAANIDVAASASFVPNEPKEFSLDYSEFSHGTHVAGTIAALDNNIGVIGVAPKAQLILIKVLSDSTGSGAFSSILSGMLHAVQQKADVINMSLGATLPHNGRFMDDNGTPDDPSDDFIVNIASAVQEILVAFNRVATYATQQGVTVIAAAGNDANNGNRDQSIAHFPSGSTNVISISATGPVGWAYDMKTSLDNLASYSNYGTSDVTFAAPGGDFRLLPKEFWHYDMILSTTAGGYTWSAGTSMASPHAAGVAALIIGKNGGDMDPAQVRAALRASADDLGKPGRDPYYGHGRVNAFRAVSAVQ